MGDEGERRMDFDLLPRAAVAMQVAMRYLSGHCYAGSLGCDLA
jgi:hypothetical protein